MKKTKAIKLIGILIILIFGIIGIQEKVLAAPSLSDAIVDVEKLTDDQIRQAYINMYRDELDYRRDHNLSEDVSVPLSEEDRQKFFSDEKYIDVNDLNIIIKGKKTIKDLIKLENNSTIAQGDWSKVRLWWNDEWRNDQAMNSRLEKLNYLDEDKKTDEEIEDLVKQIKEKCSQGLDGLSQEQLKEIDALMLKLYNSGVKGIDECRKDEMKKYMKQVSERITEENYESAYRKLMGQEALAEGMKTGVLEPESSTRPGMAESPDEIINNGKDFVQLGQQNQDKINIDGESVQKASNLIFNIIVSIGVIIAVLVGAYIGLKLIISSAEDRATIKELLLPYFVGVIILFSAFGIWKVILSLLQGVA